MSLQATARGKARIRTRSFPLTVETMEAREMLSGATAMVPHVPAAVVHQVRPVAHSHPRTAPASVRAEGTIHAQALPALALGAKALVGNLGRFALQEVGSNLAGTAIGMALEAIGIGGGDGAKIDKISAQLDSIEKQLGDISSQISALESQINLLNTKIDQATLNQIVSGLPLAQIHAAQFLFDYLLTNPKDPAAPAVRTTLLNYIGANLLDAPAKFEAAFQGLGHSTPLMRAYSSVARNALFAYNQSNGLPSEPFLASPYSLPVYQAYNYYKDYEALAINLVVEYDHALNMRQLSKAHTDYFFNQTNRDDAAMPKVISPNFVVDTRTGLIWANTVFSVGGPPQLHGDAANALANFLNVHIRDGGTWIANTVNLPPYQTKYLAGNRVVTQIGFDFLNTLADGANGGTGDLPWRIPTEAELRALVAGHTNGSGWKFLNDRWLHWAVWNDSLHRTTGPWVWASDTRTETLPGLNNGRPFIEQAIVNLNTGAVQWTVRHGIQGYPVAPTAAVMLVSSGGRSYFV